MIELESEAFHQNCDNTGEAKWWKIHTCATRNLINVDIIFSWHFVLFLILNRSQQDKHGHNRHQQQQLQLAKIVSSHRFPCLRLSRLAFGGLLLHQLFFLSLCVATYLGGGGWRHTLTFLSRPGGCLLPPRRLSGISGDRLESLSFSLFLSLQLLQLLLLDCDLLRCKRQTLPRRVFARGLCW